MLGFLLVDYLRTKDPTFSQTIALKKYLVFRAAYLYGYFVTRRLDKDSRNIKATQDKVLVDILKLNASTEYSKTHKLDQVKSREEFVHIHPLSKISQFESYINRTAQGEKKIITSETPLYFGTTSGTTGTPNLIPLVRAQLAQFKQYGGITIYNLTGRIPNIARLKRVGGLLHLLYNCTVQYNDDYPMWFCC